MGISVTWQDIEKTLQTITYPDETNSVIAFGVGLYGMNEVPYVEKELSVAAFCDNDRSKQGVNVSGHPCISPLEITGYQKPFALITTIKHYAAIAAQLAELKVPCCTLDAYVVYRYLDKFFKVYQMLDETSKEIYAGMLLSRITGSQEMIPSMCIDSQYFALPQFRFCWIKEVFVDCGAYTGENIQTFINNQAGRFKKIYAFEPNQESYSAMQRRLAHEREVWLFREEQIVCEKMFVSNEDSARVPFYVTADNPTNGFAKGDSSDVVWIESVSLDRYFERRGEERITFLKADIEGAEWDMLRGGEQIIRRSKPKVAVCIYHNIYDFFRIPLYLKELVPSYQFAVRQHWNSFEETVLYAYTDLT